MWLVEMILKIIKMRLILFAPEIRPNGINMKPAEQ